MDESVVFLWSVLIFVQLHIGISPTHDNATKDVNAPCFTCVWWIDKLMPNHKIVCDQVWKKGTATERLIVLTHLIAFVHAGPIFRTLTLYRI
jgi:hypothetical protein